MSSNFHGRKECSGEEEPSSSTGGSSAGGVYAALLLRYIKSRPQKGHWRASLFMNSAHAGHFFRPCNDSTSHAAGRATIIRAKPNNHQPIKLRPFFSAIMAGTKPSTAKAITCCTQSKSSQTITGWSQPNSPTATSPFCSLFDSRLCPKKCEPFL